MLRSLIVLAVLFGSFVPEVRAASPELEESRRNARILCEGVDKAGRVAQPCEVGPQGIAFHLDQDVSPSTASWLCQAIAQTAKKQGMTFPEHWQVMVYLPWLEDAPTATCGLPFELP